MEKLSRLGRSSILLTVLTLPSAPSAEGNPGPLPPPRGLEASVQAYEAQCPHAGADRNLLTFADLGRFLQRHRITSSREFVAAMQGDTDFEPFLSSYVLMPTSRSSQQTSASADHPRVIFFHRGMILGVTDHPTGPNRKIEIIRYDGPSKQFAFHLLDFSRPSAEARLIEQPRNCSGCHGEKPLPLWPSYNSWPGSYTHHVQYFYVPHPDLARYTPQQREAMERTLRDHVYFPRGGRPGAGPVPSPEELQRLRRLFAPVPRERTGIYAHLRPTGAGEDAAALNQFLHGLNYHRIAEEIRRSPEANRYRYATVGALLNCPDVPGFLGAPASTARRRHESEWGSDGFASLVNDVRTTLTSQFDERLAYAERINDVHASAARTLHDESDIERIAAWRYLFEKRGVDVKRFSLNFAPGGSSFGYGFSEFGAGNGGLRMAYCPFIPDLVRTDPELKELLDIPPHGYYAASPESEQRLCSSLREKSVEALRAAAP